MSDYSFDFGKLFDFDKVLLFLKLALPPFLVQLEPLHQSNIAHHHQGVICHEP